jgi:hypothetical protein
MSQTNFDYKEKAKKAVSILLWALTPINAIYYTAGNDKRLQWVVITESKINNQLSTGTAVVSLKFDWGAGNKD